MLKVVKGSICSRGAVVSEQYFHRIYREPFSTIKLILSRPRIAPQRRLRVTRGGFNKSIRDITPFLDAKFQALDLDFL